MQKKLILGTLLAIVIITGLSSELFSGSLQEQLTLPMMSAMLSTKTLTGIQSTGSRVAPTPSPVVHPAATTSAVSALTNQVQGTLLAQDTFQRANQSLWGTATDGNQWGADANTNQAFAVVNGIGQISSASAVTLNALLGPASTNVNAQVTFSTDTFANGVNAGVLLRWADANNWYKAYIDGTHFIILKHVDGQATQVLSTPFAAQSGKSYTLRFQAVGAMLFANVWLSSQSEPHNWMLEISDPSLSTGMAGLRTVMQPDALIKVTSFAVQPAQLGDDF